MKTAASEASLAATEAAALAGAGQGAADGEQRRDAAVWAQREKADKASGLTAAYNMLVGLIDDVIHIEEEGPGGGATGGSAGRPAPTLAATAAEHLTPREGDACTAASAQTGDGSLAAGSGGGAAALLGRPPRPPNSQAVPLPLASGSSKNSKKKKKKDRQRAAAAARVLGVSGGEGLGAGIEGDTDTDTSFADSGGQRKWGKGKWEGDCCLQGGRDAPGARCRHLLCFFLLNCSAHVPPAAPAPYVQPPPPWPPPRA
jgi:hypothetical protein